MAGHSAHLEHRTLQGRLAAAERVNLTPVPPARLGKIHSLPALRRYAPRAPSHGRVLAVGPCSHVSAARTRIVSCLFACPPQLERCAGCPAPLPSKGKGCGGTRSRPGFHLEHACHLRAPSCMRRYLRLLAGEEAVSLGIRRHDKAVPALSPILRQAVVEPRPFNVHLACATDRARLVRGPTGQGW